MKPLILSAILILPFTMHGQILTQTFSGYADGTTISSGTVTNWTQPAGTAGKSIVSSTAGYPSGNGLSILEAGVDARYTTGGNYWTQAQGTAVFSVDFLRTGSISNSQFIISSYGGAGFFVDVGASSVLLSTGGASVFTATTQSVAATTNNNTWYTLEIKFSLSGTANTSTGLVTLYETASPGNVLFSNAAITAAGSTGALTSLNRVDLRRFGGGTNVLQVDNMALSAVPEPSTVMQVALAGALGVLVVLRRRRVAA